MTLQSSGAISLANVNTELGRSSTATISLGETAVRTLAGVASGAISLSNLYGKSNVTFTPDGGTSAGAPALLSDTQMFSASVSIECSAQAVWTWSKTGSSFAFASIASGQSNAIISFYLETETQYRTAVFNVTGVSGGVTRYYQVLLTVEGNN
jgi:hypothetical protein